MMIRSLWRIVFVVLFLSSTAFAHGESLPYPASHIQVTTTTIRCSGAIARIHRSTVSSTCRRRRNVAVLAVGTAMKTQDYDLLAKAVVQGSTHNIVVVVLDFNPYDPLKRSSKAYARAVDEVLQKLDEILPPCDGEPIVLVGGHSAGGSSAMEAILQDLFATRISGYIGLDPYYVRPVGDTLRVPALQWGFANTTCGVSVQNAAKAAYQRSSVDFRIFYQLSERYSHCCFTDAGCMWVCSCAQSNGRLLHDIGISVDQLLSAIHDKSRFSRRRFSTANFNLESSEFSIQVDSIPSPVTRLDLQTASETG